MALQGFILITTFILPIAYAELRPYSGGDVRVDAWIFAFGSYDNLENRFVFFDPSYFLSFSHLEFIVTVALWITISFFLFMSLRKVSGEEPNLTKAWIGVLAALVSQMILPRLFLQLIPASHYGWMTSYPIQSIIAIIGLFVIGVPTISHCIMISSFIAPFAFGYFHTPIFTSGDIWYFPFWEFIRGSGESGEFAFISILGYGFLPITLEILTAAILVATGIILAEVVRRAKKDTWWQSIGFASVLAALGLQTIFPLIVNSIWQAGSLSTLWPIIPLPVPSILAIIGLIMIRWRPPDKNVI